MLEVKVTKEIKTYKAKLWMGFTSRQLICLGAAFAINIPLYIYGKNYIGEEPASWLCMFIAFPLVYCGFFDYNGMPYEKFAAKWLLNTFFYPQKRKYKTENLFEILHNMDNIKSKKAVKNKKNDINIEG